MAALYVVATPIGNLKDITLRALEVLKKVDFILAEDTRVTKKLLNHFGIETKILSYHQHSKLKKINYILELLRRGKNLALVCDAGTPGISDPGGKLVDKVYSLECKVICVPGPSAITAAASISGFPMDKFLFLGFPPQKRKRKKFFKEVINSRYPVIFYESPYRILKTLKELKLSYYHCHGNLNTTLQVVVCRELTKKFETVYRGTIEEVIEKVKEDKTKGEFVVIINPT
ncbi:MAG: 16S rRNA (cytidine(1402)-2'-O)-methyltransferase [Candidatus Nealsonbacteria bacterium]|nr:MAG: 16S rRNA (cytidine(1402)-2'-O)-methyltransferase [Candidatus Nealsonbacteria bacterium]